MARDLELGLVLGYWAGGPPPGAAEAVAGGRAARLRLGVDRGGVRLRRADAARVVGVGDRADQARHSDRPDLGADAGRHRDGRDDARPSLGRPLDPRARRFRSAGRRGLVRPAVRQAARAHARVHRDPARHLGAPGAGDERRAPLPAAAPDGHGPRQAAEVSIRPLREDIPIYLARRGAEEHRARRRAVRRLAGAVLLAPPRRLLPRGAARGLRPPGRAAHAEDVRGRRAACR